MEIWKTIPFLDDRYAVSNKGRVMNVKTGKVLKDNQFKDTGYRKISIKYNKKVYTFFIHKLVLMVFEPNTLHTSLHAHHIDFNRENNTLDNLVWMAAKDNSNNKTRNTDSFLLFTKLLIKYGDIELHRRLSTL